jgi:hypothetical protein
MGNRVVVPAWLFLVLETVPYVFTVVPFSNLHGLGREIPPHLMTKSDSFLS